MTALCHQSSSFMFDKLTCNSRGCITKNVKPELTAPELLQQVLSGLIVC